MGMVYWPLGCCFKQERKGVIKIGRGYLRLEPQEIEIQQSF